MKKHLDGWDIAAQIRLERQVHKGAFLLLEGETDTKVLGKFLDADNCVIVVAFGKDNSLEALRLLEDEGFDGLLCIVDADFDRLTNRKYDSEHLILTDCHDMDLTIFASPALDHFIKERGDPNKLKSFCGTVQMLREIVLEAATPIAYCRWLSELRSLAFKFENLGFDFISSDTLACDLVCLLDALFANSRRTRAIRTEFEVQLNMIRRGSHDRLQLCSGHDVAEILGMSLRRSVGGLREQQSWASEIEAGLRLAYDWRSFEQSAMYAAILKWQKANQPYMVLEPAH